MLNKLIIVQDFIKEVMTRIAMIVVLLYMLSTYLMLHSSYLFGGIAINLTFDAAKYFKKSLVWNIVSINALWVWWKCRCSKKYEGIEYTVVDIIKMFWDNLVHTVKGEYDNIKGTAEKVCKKRRKIRQIWYPIPLWLDGTHENSWNYMPPRWLFPPPSPFLFQS